MEGGKEIKIAKKKSSLDDSPSPWKRQHTKNDG
jgi:hypothetical protein